MAESWIAFFELIVSITKEFKLKVRSNSELAVLEGMQEKMEFCVNGVSRLNCVIVDALNDPAIPIEDFNDYVYLHTEMKRLLTYLYDDLEKLRNLLIQKQSSTAVQVNQFPSGVIAYTSNRAHHRGRPSLCIDIEAVTFLRSLNFSWTNIAASMGISRSTLYRKCKEHGVYNVESQQFSSYRDLLPVVQDIKQEFPDIGERLLMGILHSRGIRCSRETLRTVIHDIDPINTALRWSTKIVRRSYSVPGPNSLWHIDGNHKLVRWNMVIHGAIDGYSRLVVYLHCANNNFASTVMEQFVSATRSYFIPSRVRCDKGTENMEVAKFMLLERGFDRGSVITGSSVHNQRIERLWRDLFRGVTYTYYKLFYGLEALGVLNPVNPIHLYALHVVYIPRINRSLEIFRQGWNNHGLSTMKNASPLQLFTLGIAKLQASGEIAIDFNKIVEDDYGIDFDGPVVTEGEETVIVPRIELRLTANGTTELQRLNVLQDSEDSGIDIFLNTLHIIEQNIIEA